MTRSTSADACCCSSASLRLVEQAHVLDRDRRLVGERLHQRDLLVGERPRLHAPQRDRADRVAFAHQRHRQDRAVPMPRCSSRAIGNSLRGAAAMSSRWTTARSRTRATGDRAAGERHRRSPSSSVGVLAESCDASCSASPSTRTDRRLGRVAKLSARSRDGVEHGLHVAGRAADHAQDLADRRLLLERLLRLVEQPHVVDRDRRLPCERLDQRDLVGREQARLAAEQEYAAVCAAFAHQRDGQHGRGSPGGGCSRPRSGNSVSSERQDVREMDGGTVDHGAPGERRRGRPAPECRRTPARSSNPPVEPASSPSISITRA